MSRYDVAIVGGGIAGASLGAALAPHARVVILEGEDVAGYHSTGRSAAFWSETYGGPGIQPLTSASGALLAPWLAPLGSLHIGRAGDEARIEAMVADFAHSGVPLTRIDPASRIPGLREEWKFGLLEPTCAYIDVAGLHQAMLGDFRKAGGELLLYTPFESATREGGRWRIRTDSHEIQADILVDAAGAWADPVAKRAGVKPIGIKPYRRTIAQLRTAPSAPEGLPHVADIAGSFYFKPEAGGRLWLSPHDETLVDPCDVAPEELDVAIAIDRFERAVDWRVEAVERKWAGLRSFAPDRHPVYGFDREVPGFFWCAGQGGFGIQTAPAAALLAASVLLGTTPDSIIAAIDPSRYAPTRFSR